MILVNRYRSVSYRTVPIHVPYRYMYRTVRYGTVPIKQRTVNGNICPKRESNLRCHRLTLQTKKVPRPASIEKKYRNGALDTLGQIYGGRPSRYSNPDTLGSSIKQMYHVKFGFLSHSYESWCFGVTYQGKVSCEVWSNDIISKTIVHSSLDRTFVAF